VQAGTSVTLQSGNLGNTQGYRVLARSGSCAAGAAGVRAGARCAKPSLRSVSHSRSSAREFRRTRSDERRLGLQCSAGVAHGSPGLLAGAAALRTALRGAWVRTRSRSLFALAGLSARFPSPLPVPSPFGRGLGRGTRAHARRAQRCGRPELREYEPVLAAQSLRCAPYRTPAAPHASSQTNSLGRRLGWSWLRFAGSAQGSPWLGDPRFCLPSTRIAATMLVSLATRCCDSVINTQGLDDMVFEPLSTGLQELLPRLPDSGYGAEECYQGCRTKVLPTYPLRTLEAKVAPIASYPRLLRVTPQQIASYPLK
jgi:hypothetical protein